MKMYAFCIVFILGACGISKPSYKKYSSDAETGGSTTPTDNSTAKKEAANLAAFEKEMAVVKTNCAISGCHLSTAISGTKLSATDSSINRKAILAYTGTTSTALDSKLRGSGHGGGKQTNPTKIQIDAWLTVENSK
ncbi:MAG: hypothetical protein WCI18_08950 [Pseudomonadota bacterium]